VHNLVKSLLQPQGTCLIAYQTFLTKKVQLLQLANSMQNEDVNSSMSASLNGSSIVQVTPCKVAQSPPRLTRFPCQLKGDPTTCTGSVAPAKQLQQLSTSSHVAHNYMLLYHRASSPGPYVVQVTAFGGPPQSPSGGSPPPPTQGSPPPPAQGPSPPSSSYSGSPPPPYAAPASPPPPAQVRSQIDLAGSRRGL